MKRFAQIVVSLTVLFGGMVIMNKVRYRYAWDDAFWRTLLAPITKTVWAEKFSETNFAKIKNGMTNAEVLKLLSEPLDRNCDKDGCIWPYSYWHKDAIEFDRRWVVFDNQGRVNHVWHQFYID